MQKNFSYPLKIAELNQNEYRYVLNADDDELVDISHVLQVERALSFQAEIFLRYNQREHILRVWGTVDAVLELQSVVSLKTFRRRYKAPFELIFDTQATYRDIREIGSDINVDVPDIIENGEINLADIAMEQVALQIEDYPRAKGEVFTFSASDDTNDEVKENPFAVLEKLKK